MNAIRCLCVLSLCACVLFACGSENGQIVQMNDNSSAIGAETGEEWVAISDFVAVVTVLEEKVERPETPGEGQADSGLSSYLVDIDTVVWEDPGAEPVVPDSPTEIFGAGWVFRSDSERPFFPHLEVGNSYLMPLGVFGEDGLGPLTFESIIPVDGDGKLLNWTVQVADGETITIPAIPAPLAEELPNEASVGDVQSYLASLAVPTDLRSAHLSPVDRYLALQSVED